MTYNCRFEEAQKLVDGVLRKDSMSLEWNYYDGVVLLRSMIARQEYEERERFFAIMNRVIQIGEKRLGDNPQDTNALFFTGGAYGFTGMYYAHDGSYLKAVSTGKKGIELHEKLIAISPNYYDAYLSLAVFHFYASGVPWFVKPILYIFGKSGDEDKAIEYASLVSRKGHLAQYEAKFMLYELSMRRKDYEHAINAIQSLALQFPNNHLYTVRACELLDYTGRYSAVIDVGRRVWDVHHTPNYVCTKYDSSRFGGVCFCLGKAYTALGQSREAIEVFDEIVRDNLCVYFHDDIFYLLGTNYEQENDRENAMRCYRKVIESNSSSELVRKAQGRLENIPKKDDRNVTK
jgi:tetratricopeptide (TPR) repeat protein